MDKPNFDAISSIVSRITSGMFLHSSGDILIGEISDMHCFQGGGDSSKNRQRIVSHKNLGVRCTTSSTMKTAADIPELAACIRETSGTYDQSSIEEGDCV